MCTAVIFDASFDCERTFVMDLLPKVVKKSVSLTFVDSSKKISSDCTNNQSELVFGMSCGLPREAVESISGYAWS